MNEKKSLLEKYSIPVDHLDFDYIRDCRNVRELEKIIEILKSNEEGYYPDLTRFAEEQLKGEDPDNRMLRIEVKCQRTSMNDKQEINEFVQSIKSKDRKMRVQSNSEDNSDSLPPIRTVINSSETQVAVKNKEKRINATDYNQWDKFDADTECLKIDLAEEQIREKAAIAQKQQQKKSKLIEILPEKTLLEKINDVEKHEFADKHRIKGNEFFKCCDYQQAIIEYNASLTYESSAAVYNNRALVYLKQKKYAECMQDCDECLKLEPKNVKAMLRKCEALVATDQKNEAYKIYSYILKMEPGNVIAKKALKNISLRLEIQDVNVQSQGIRLTEIESQGNDGIDDELYRKLIIPQITPRNKFSGVMTSKSKN
ncbi:sperm-associated antigen 1 [Sitodiplosis mosellana]|uniref:sperm-associated antigen 1 n=1 Tax=Sitodiplosis mosellana TaxID=263140 RepID=UPI0024448AFB|nr:sperm-associated antigen 1 [Sitodiplosis mosellana]